jgi:hypothetical protein
MSYEDEVTYPRISSESDWLTYIKDLLQALIYAKHGNAVASQHRKKNAYLPTRLAGKVIKSLNTSGVGWYKTMTPKELHAELVYTETLYEKALLGMAHSGDWLSFVKEV